MATSMLSAQSRSIAAAASKPKPDLTSVISGATSIGSWTAQSRAVLASCLEDGDEDAGVRQALS